MRNNITIRGQWMYPPEANTLLIAMVHAGLLDLSKPEVQAFALERVNEAVAAAAGDEGRAVRAVIAPTTR